MMITVNSTFAVYVYATYARGTAVATNLHGVLVYAHSSQMDRIYKVAKFVKR